MPDVSREDVPRDHPLAESFSQIDKRRTKKSIADIFDFSGDLEREDVGVGSSESHGVSVEPTSYLGDDKFSEFSEQAKESDALGYNWLDKTNFLENDTKLSSPRPFEVHADRSTKAAKQDSQQKARVTTDPDLYASDPNRYDYPFVDTPAEFNKQFRSTDWQKFDRMAGKDDVFRF